MSREWLEIPMLRLMGRSDQTDRSVKDPRTEVFKARSSMRSWLQIQGSGHRGEPSSRFHYQQLNCAQSCEAGVSVKAASLFLLLSATGLHETGHL